MLQDGVRGNNYPHRKSWTKIKKKAQLQALCWNHQRRMEEIVPFAIFLELFLALPAGFLSSGWPDR